jgi:hypothetical protein
MSESQTSTYSTIEKETISQLSFPSSEVLTTNPEKEIRDSRIEKAMKLGNNKKQKVKILFEDSTDRKRVETTIWGVTEKNILLKQDVFIPIHRIHEIKFF